MKLIRVNTRNDIFQMLETIKHNRQKRYRARCFFVEGVRNINGAHRYGWQFEGFLYNAKASLSDWAKDMLAAHPDATQYALAPELMEALSDRETTSEMIALVRRRENDPNTLRLSESPLVAVFDRPSNKGNLGSVIRSVDALGVDALLITGHGVDIYDPDVVLSTVGSLFSTQVIFLETPALDTWIAAQRERYPGLQLVGTTAHKAVPVYKPDYTKPTILMIGNETTGLSAKYRETVDLAVTIPMAEDCYASSFNAACAATTVFYEAVRQRRIAAEENV